MIVPVKEEKKKKYFQLRRKDFINAQKTVDIILSAPDRKSEKLPPYVHIYNSILVNRWEAHKNLINFILKIPDPLSFASCSHDKNIKIWSLSGECHGRVYLIHYFFFQIFTILFNKYLHNSYRYKSRVLLFY